jgi:hypothetical protein
MPPPDLPVVAWTVIPLTVDMYYETPVFAPGVCGGQVFGRGRPVVPKRSQEISPRA